MRLELASPPQLVFIPYRNYKTDPGLRCRDYFTRSGVGAHGNVDRDARIMRQVEIEVDMQSQVKRREFLFRMGWKIGSIGAVSTVGLLGRQTGARGQEPANERLPTTNEIRDYLLRNSPWVNLKNTVDTVLRAHDTWDNWPEIGIRDSWAKYLGFTKRLREGSRLRWTAVYEIPETTLRGFAQQIAFT
jgi:hypothetical protein